MQLLKTFNFYLSDGGFKGEARRGLFLFEKKNLNNLIKFSNFLHLGLETIYVCV